MLAQDVEECGQQLIFQGQNRGGKISLMSLKTKLEILIYLWYLCRMGHISICSSVASAISESIQFNFKVFCKQYRNISWLTKKEVETLKNPSQIVHTSWRFFWRSFNVVFSNALGPLQEHLEISVLKLLEIISVLFLNWLWASPLHSSLLACICSFSSLLGTHWKYQVNQLIRGVFFVGVYFSHNAFQTLYRRGDRLQSYVRWLSSGYLT